MSKLDRHGLRIVGLRKASGETRSYSDPNKYDELFYDTNSGEVWTRFHCSIGRNTWTEYLDPAIVRLGTTDRHMTMQEIADWIRDTVAKM